MSNNSIRGLELYAQNRRGTTKDKGNMDPSKTTSVLMTSSNTNKTQVYQDLL